MSTVIVIWRTRKLKWKVSKINGHGSPRDCVLSSERVALSDASLKSMINVNIHEFSLFSFSNYHRP